LDPNPIAVRTQSLTTSPLSNQVVICLSKRETIPYTHRMSNGFAPNWVPASRMLPGGKPNRRVRLPHNRAAGNRNNPEHPLPYTLCINAVDSNQRIWSLQARKSSQNCTFLLSCNMQAPISFCDSLRRRSRPPTLNYHPFASYSKANHENAGKCLCGTAIAF
jgi:hypothetical protein